MNISLVRTWLLAHCCAAIVFVSSASGQLPAPYIDQIYPLGGKAGSTVELEINGNHLEEGNTLQCDHPGITGAAIEGKKDRYNLTIASDVLPGIYDLRVVGRFGISGARSFQVSQALTEVTKAEPNDSPEQAQVIQVNSAINGRSDGANLDFYRISLKSGQRISIDVECQKLEVQLDANLNVLDSAGRTLASSGDYHGRDSFVCFNPPADGDYFITFNDLSYRGGPPYRLLVTDLPHIETVTPRAVRRGDNPELTFHGQNLGMVPATSPELALAMVEEWKTQVGIIDVGADSFRYLEQATDYSQMPTAATCRIMGAQVRVQTPRGAAYNPITLMMVDEPVALESEPNDKADAPQALTIPCALTGRCDLARDIDWYAFTAEESTNYAFDVYAEAFGSPTDPYFVLTNEKGERMNEFDDYGHRANAFDGHLRDPSGQFGLEKGKKYRIMVQDRYRRGGLRYQYVLRVTKRAPEVFAASVQPHNNQATAVTLGKGGAAYLDIVLHQREGEGTPVTITAEGLPPSIHFSETTIPNDTRGKFVLWCDENAPDWTGDFKLFATYNKGDQTIRREVRNYNRVWQNNGNRPIRQLAASIREKSPFDLVPQIEKIEIEAGQKADIKFMLKRLWPEFTGGAKLLPLEWQGNFQTSEVAMPDGATEATMTVQVQNGTQPGTYTLAAQCQAQVPYHKDPNEKNRPNTLVTLPSRPIQVVVTKPAK
jgi:hypothetical protein